ncbi:MULTISPECIES: helix-turn-helix domain-containing protein [unclassified Enterococcus]|uniref:helix-turn-helix domain-containing protein n=1 Tax=unclassified Enterococcus TaxID=2608891 RepID=UPI0015535381|nr:MULTISPECIES: helix-turn-helix domain-containing protein [unclassified Enterococcus]MBS7577961.1 helix-turn-helix domain-containing protein [Enterococcus sp. MMGLQ5-2]MBS7585178.1 helix-turn-helix domain-containing protein [Enterococcus sp. MMGLQ5-1]NPD13035.1 helix-turn-helix domain-containing protein [Enterococcus sp. MMGLQ5-1]NPD37791.1 helix-turn-helix domain-containing protein [Enterococcus sp. MMGLQ5-2]
MFTNFFTKKEITYIKLIEEAYTNNQIQLSKLNSEFSIETDQIEYEIKKINSIITPNYFETTKSSLNLVTVKSENISNIYANFLKNNIYFNILEKLFFNSQLTIFDLSQELFLSLSTLKRKLSELRKILSPFNIEIKTRPLRVVGDEKNIIDLYTIYFLEAYPSRPYPFPEAQIDLFIEFYKTIHKDWGKKSQITEIGHDTTKVLINLYRQKSGFQYKALPNPEKIHTGLNLSSLSSSEFVNSFKAIFKMDLTSDIIVRIFSNYLDFPYQFSYQYLMANQKDKVIQEKTIATEAFLNQLSSSYSIPIVNKQDLILEIVNYLSEMEYRKIPTFILNDSSTRFILENKEISEDFFLNFKHIFEQHIEPIVSVEINIYEIFFRVIINWDHLLYSIILRQPKVNVGILLNSFTAHSNFIVEQLNLQHSNFANFYPIYVNDSLESIENYDLILTNISDFKTSCKKIIIDMALMDNDWVKIANEIRNIRQAKFNN